MYKQNRVRPSSWSLNDARHTKSSRQLPYAVIVGVSLGAKLREVCGDEGTHLCLALPRIPKSERLHRFQNLESLSWRSTTWAWGLESEDFTLRHDGRLQNLKRCRCGITIWCGVLERQTSTFQEYLIRLITSTPPPSPSLFASKCLTTLYRACVTPPRGSQPVQLSYHRDIFAIPGSTRDISNSVQKITSAIIIRTRSSNTRLSEWCSTDLAKASI